MPNTNKKILILDFGSQYTQLIARRVRESEVYSEIVPYHLAFDKIKSHKAAGLILSGGPSSILEKDAPLCDPRIFELGITSPSVSSTCRCTYGIFKFNDLFIR